MSTLLRSGPSARAWRCRKKFLDVFPRGFQDETYLDWERDYKWRAHEAWRDLLGPSAMKGLLGSRRYLDVAARAVRIESRTNLLFSFEKMALRDAVKPAAGARIFACGLDVLLRGPGSGKSRFEAWCGALERLPRRQTRVLTWPLATVFGFIAHPAAMSSSSL